MNRWTFCARAFVGCRGALAQLMHAAMHVRMVQALLQRHRLVNRPSATGSTPRCPDTPTVCRARAAAAPESLAKRREIAPQRGVGSVLPWPRSLLRQRLERAVTRSSTWLRRSSVGDLLDDGGANAVVTDARAAAASSPRARK